MTWMLLSASKTECFHPPTSHPYRHHGSSLESSHPHTDDADAREPRLMNRSYEGSRMQAISKQASPAMKTTTPEPQMQIKPIPLSALGPYLHSPMPLAPHPQAHAEDGSTQRDTQAACSMTRSDQSSYTSNAHPQSGAEIDEALEPPAGVSPLPDTARSGPGCVTCTQESPTPCRWGRPPAVRLKSFLCLLRP